MKESVSLGTARRIAAWASGLPPAFGSGREGAAAALRRLGSLQIDTISVVERAHLHVLWSRAPNAGADPIAALEAEPRLAFEYWSHAAAYLPLEEYRFSLSRMERIRSQGHAWFRADQGAVDYVLGRIRAEGPLRAQDFAEPMKGPRGWWDWKPAKVALEYLFHSGALAVATRRGFQKVYDLPERALPSDLDARRPSPAEEAARHVDRAVSSLGLFARDEVAYLRKDGLGGIDAELAARVEAGSLVEVEVEAPAGSSGSASGRRRGPVRYASPAALEAAAALPTRPAPRAFILSPFDPLVIDRRRLARLFGLDYQVECYVPAAKRRFGYFALPVLFRDGFGDFGFAALADARADRRAKVLELRRLSLEPFEAATAPGGPRRRRATLEREFAAALAAELGRFAAFNGAERVELGQVSGLESREGAGNGGGGLEAALRSLLA